MQLGDRVAQIELESLSIHPKCYYFWSIYAKLGVVTDIEQERIRVVFDGDLIWLPSVAVAKFNGEEFKKKEKQINDLHRFKVNEFITHRKGHGGIVVALHPSSPVVCVDIGKDKIWYNETDLCIIRDKIDPNRSFLRFKRAQNDKIDKPSIFFKISST